MSKSQNLYEILNVNKDCSIAEIKSQYKKLALLYHPDKNSSSDAKYKFIDINNAYQVLSDPIKRNEYDQMSEDQRVIFYNQLHDYIKQKIPNLDNYINFFFSNDTEFRNFVLDIDVVGILKKMVTKISSVNIFNNCNIYGTVSASIEDKYFQKYREIQVTRQTRETKTFFIPLADYQTIFKNEGEFDPITGKYGDIIINVKTEHHSQYFIIDDDLYYNLDISLYEYLYGGEFIIDHFNEKILISHLGFIIDSPIIIKSNKGLKKMDGTCGDLIIIIKIRNLNEIKDKIHSLEN